MAEIKQGAGPPRSRRLRGVHHRRPDQFEAARVQSAHRSRRAPGMNYMLKYLIEHPEKGLLGYQTGGSANVQYWRSFDTSRHSPKTRTTPTLRHGATSGNGSARTAVPASGTRPTSFARRVRGDLRQRAPRGLGKSCRLVPVADRRRPPAPEGGHQTTGIVPKRLKVASACFRPSSTPLRQPEHVPPPEGRSDMFTQDDPSYGNEPPSWPAPVGSPPVSTSILLPARHRRSVPASGTGHSPPLRR